MARLRFLDGVASADRSNDEKSHFVGSLPGKRAFGNLQPQFVEERKAALARYLQLCISTREIASSSIFCNFVEADKYSGQFQREQLAAPAASLSTEIGRIGTKQGYLLKQGRRLASWKRRYFCLCDSELFYYYTAEMSNPFQPLGVISPVSYTHLTLTTKAKV